MQIKDKKKAKYVLYYRYCYCLNNYGYQIESDEGVIKTFGWYQNAEAWLNMTGEDWTIGV